MIYEVARVTVDQTRRDEFVEAYTQAWKNAGFEGAHKVEILLCVEDANRVDIIIEWNDVAAHDQHRLTPKKSAYLAAIESYVDAVEVQHFEFNVVAT